VDEPRSSLNSGRAGDTVGLVDLLRAPHRRRDRLGTANGCARAGRRGLGARRRRARLPLLARSSALCAASSRPTWTRMGACSPPAARQPRPPCLRTARANGRERRRALYVPHRQRLSRPHSRCDDLVLARGRSATRARLRDHRFFPSPRSLPGAAWVDRRALRAGAASPPSGGFEALLPCPPSPGSEHEGRRLRRDGDDRSRARNRAYRRPRGHGRLALAQGAPRRAGRALGARRRGPTTLAGRRS
jgi:hypothetical protein